MRVKFSSTTHQRNLQNSFKNTGRFHILQWWTYKKFLYRVFKSKGKCKGYIIMLTKSNRTEFRVFWDNSPANRSLARKIPCMILLHWIRFCVFVLKSIVTACFCFFLYLTYSCVHCRLSSRYHYFKIKALRGTLLVIQNEDGNTYDPHALECLLPREMERIPEVLREVQIFSKSQRKTYTLEDVKGQQIGRVQHFLNTQLHGYLRCGKITRIEGYVTVFLLYCYWKLIYTYLKVGE